MVSTCLLCTDLGLLQVDHHVEKLSSQYFLKGKYLLRYFTTIIESNSMVCVLLSTDMHEYNSIPLSKNHVILLKVYVK